MRYRFFFIGFSVAGILLSDAMCAAAGYRWRGMEYHNLLVICSAPAWVSLVGCLPYLAGIAICAVAVILLSRKAHAACRGEK